MDAETLERLDNYDPDAVVLKRNQSFLTKHISVWSKNFITQQFQNSSSSEVVSAKPSVPIVCKQSTAKIEFSIPEIAKNVQGISDNELASQYTKKESPSSPIITARKRKRTNENISPSQSQARWSIESALRSEASEDNECGKFSNGLPSLLDPFAELVTKPISESTTPLRKSNPFVKLKTPSNEVKTSAQISPGSPTFSALQTFSQLRKFDTNGQEVITSAYFHTEKVTSNILSCDSHIVKPVNICQAVIQQHKPVAANKDARLPTVIKNPLNHLVILLLSNMIVC